MTSPARACLPLLRRAAGLIGRGCRGLRTLPLGRTPCWREVEGGYSMRIDPADWMDRAFYTGSYGRPLVRLIAATVRPGEISIDAGAQKGFLTLQMARAAGPEGLVVAFEPDPRAMEALALNVERNGLRQVRLHACALGDREGRCEFVLSRQLGWSSRFPNAAAEAAAAGVMLVRTRRLDDVLAEEGVFAGTRRVSLLKIDAEGSEPLVLEGARETLGRFRPAVHVEINKPSLRAGGFSARSVEALLRSLDYRLYAIRLEGLRERLCLAPLASLESGIGECEDVLALGSPPC